MSFGGETYDEAHDGQRLGAQLAAVLDVMKDGEWRTLGRLHAEVRELHQVNPTEAGVSARLRDLRKDKFGAHTVERRRVEGCNGLWQYRVVVNQQRAAA